MRLCALLLLTAIAAAAEKSATADGTAIALGCELYQHHCVACHGKCGTGDGPAAYSLSRRPKNLSDSDYWDESDEDLLEVITNGKRAMPAHKKLLTDKQRFQVLAYMRTLAPQKIKPAPAVKTASSEGK